MSISMLLGRVVLPLAGLAVATVLVSSLVGASPPPSPPPPFVPVRAAETSSVIVAEGRVVTYPGAQVTIGAETTGTIVCVNVAEKTTVKRGDLLVEFRTDELRAQVGEAEARLAEAEADVARLEADYRRSYTLFSRNATSHQEYVTTGFNLRAQRARRDALAALLERFVAQLARYRIVAPIDGVVTARQAQPGETVVAATPLLALADLSHLRIEVEVDEYDLAYAHVGARVKITAEGYPGHSWPGEVEEIADVLIGRRIRPEDPGKPTDTRVLPVRIAFREFTPLRLGQRVEVEIERSTEGALAEPNRPSTPTSHAVGPEAALDATGGTASPSAKHSA
jgi:RND family efflux transporter MFP subunit